MSRTAEDIKKGLLCRIRSYKDVCDHQCDTCDLRIPAYTIFERYEDALALIQQLQDENTELSGKIGQLQAERDAAVKDLKDALACFACEQFCRNGGGCNGGSRCDGYGFKWRGAPKEE